MRFDESGMLKVNCFQNNCLYTGLNLIIKLYVLVIEFRISPTTADIKQAFFQIKTDEHDREFTRFFWDVLPLTEDPFKEFKTLRLTRIIFSVKPSTLILAATIKHHLQGI